MEIKFNFEEKINQCINFIEKGSWFFTIVVFSLVLMGAIVVWNDCVLNPRPSQTALDNISKSEKEYQDKIDKIKNNNEKIKERIDNFDNPGVNLKERDYFKKVFQENTSSSNYSNYNNYNPKIVN